MDYFKQLTDLLKIEQEEDKRGYRQMAENASLADRKAAGLTWYPIIIRDTEMTRGDYLTVEIERPANQDIPHQFRFGAAAALFSNRDPSTDRLEGVVTFQGGQKLRLTLRTDELPDWADTGKLGLDLLFDDNSYAEMFAALRQAPLLAEKEEEGRLVRVLTGQKKPGFHPEPGPFHTKGLNPSQTAAVEKILAANELAIVHGPPGTGKTTTLVQAIRALIAKGQKKILVTAPSNTAVDLLSEKLSEQGLNVLRIGNPARVSDRLTELTLDSKMAAHSGMKEIRRLKKRAAEFRNMAHKYKRSYGPSERAQRKALFDEARNILKEVERTESFIQTDLMEKAQIIAATLVGANHYTVRDLKYDVAVIDEAGQALEPACWIPILKARKLILAGDHHQLPPTIKSMEAARKGLSHTLLEKCVARFPEAVTLLEEQYRMNEMIMGYSSRVFYEGRLKAHPTVARHQLMPEDTPLQFVDTAGCSFDELTEGTSTSNPEEAAFLFKHLTQLVTQLAPRYKSAAFPDIAVISPYRRQIDLLREQLISSPLLQPYADKISVNTIDSFQGQERDIVYISMTRSNTENKIGFLSDIRRMNVAMTRARKKLVVIGDSGTLANLRFYEDLISYAQQQDAYRSAWEFSGL